MLFRSARKLFELIRSDAIKVLGGTCVDNDDQLRSQLDVLFASVPLGIEDELVVKHGSGEKTKYVGKQKLKKAILTKFKEAFGTEPVGTSDLPGEPELRFQTGCCGWILSTDFCFGRQPGCVEYSHSISSEETFERRRAVGYHRGFLTLSTNISFDRWMGIGGATRWEYVTDSEIDLVADTIVRFSRQFFEVAPKLLKGLELKKISSA